MSRPFTWQQYQNSSRFAECNTTSKSVTRLGRYWAVHIEVDIWVKLGI